MIARYEQICETKGIKKDNKNYVFNFKVNNKSIKKESVSYNDVKNKIVKGVKESLDEYAESFIKEYGLFSGEVIQNQFLIHSADCEYFDVKYTGYGIYDFQVTINDVVVGDFTCDFYHTVDDFNVIKEKNEDIYLSSVSEDKSDEVYYIWSGSHGPQG